MSFESLGKMIIIIGITLVAMGGLVMLGGKIGPIGRLPGDIFVERGNFKFYFPLATMLILSLLLSLFLNLFFRR